MSYILSADAAVYYEEYGTGAPLVLLPGLLGSIDTHWRRFIPDFARHFHTISVDLRGHGRTNNPSRMLRLGECVDDLEALLDTLQIEQALLCGYSLGGYIALAFAIRSPEQVRAVALHATRFYWTDAAAAEAARGLDPDAAELRSPEWVAALDKDHSRGNGPGGWRDLMNAAGPFLRSLPTEGIAESALRDVRCPVLITQCEGDEMVPRAEAERLAAALPAARLHFFEGCRHQMQSVPKQPFLEVAVPFLQAPHLPPA